MAGKKKNAGLTLPEMLLAMTIMAILMTAIATAMHGALMSYAINERLAELTQTARATLEHMTRQIRTASAIQYSNGLLRIVPPTVVGGVTEVQYELVENELLYRRTVSGQQSSYPLISGSDDVKISSFNIYEQRGLDWQGLDCTKSITVQVVFTIGSTSFPISATSVPRRNL